MNKLIHLYSTTAVDEQVVYTFENLFHHMVRDIFSLYIESFVASEEGRREPPEIANILYLYFPVSWLSEALRVRHHPELLEVSYQATQVVLRYNNSVQCFVMENSFEGICNLVGEVLEIFFKELSEALVWHNPEAVQLGLKHFILSLNYEPSLQNILTKRSFVPIPRISKRQQPFLHINIQGLQLTPHAHQLLENYIQKIYLMVRICLLERCRMLKKTFMPDEVVLITKNMIKQLNSQVFVYKPDE